ncbi:transferase [Aureococcus anophagefferens]|nr:transferase [Aureococcus anophagefferens]
MMMKSTLAALALAPAAALRGEVWEQHEVEAAGFVWRGNSTEESSHLLLHERIKDEDLPAEFTWGNVSGVSYLTMSRNQHIPQYCGSCWAHGSVSALADRVKIARKAQGADINPSVQHILNCQGGGTCHGGSLECTEGICPGGDWTCTPINIARTCSTFPPAGTCTEITPYPQITIDDYGSISGQKAMQKEIYARGSIACGIDAGPILNYTTGVATGAGEGVDHVISVVGWGVEGGTSYWIVRNSWGEYWGEMGYVRVAFGALMVEALSPVP